MPLCTLGCATVLPLMACKVCGDQIYGWITYHEEWLQDGHHPYVAYCYECTNHDVAMTTELKKMPWTLRVRCAHWANQSDPFSRCNECWQSCRIKGGSTSHCLRYWGWGKSANKPNWYCPKHVQTQLGDQKPPKPDCDCPKTYGDPAAAGGAVGDPAAAGGAAGDPAAAGGAVGDPVAAGGAAGGPVAAAAGCVEIVEV